MICFEPRLIYSEGGVFHSSVFRRIHNPTYSSLRPHVKLFPICKKNLTVFIAPLHSHSGRTLVPF